MRREQLDKELAEIRERIALKRGAPVPFVLAPGVCEVCFERDRKHLHNCPRGGAEAIERIIARLPDLPSHEPRSNAMMLNATPTERAAVERGTSEDGSPFVEATVKSATVHIEPWDSSRNRFNIGDAGDVHVDAALMVQIVQTGRISSEELTALIEALIVAQAEAKAAQIFAA